jgi:hypothetical protein
MDIASALIAERSFWGLSMQDVADHCGLTVPGLLRRKHVQPFPRHDRAQLFSARAGTGPRSRRPIEVRSVTITGEVQRTGRGMCGWVLARHAVGRVDSVAGRPYTA